MLQSNFDLIVIGAGSGGVRAARMAAATGARVAIIERRFYGGTCVNVGCVPKKLLVYASEFSRDFRDAEGYGWTLSGAPRFDWPTLVANKNAEIQRLNGIYERLLQNSGVELIWGSAKLLGQGCVKVGDKVYSAGKILLAVGGKPFVPDFPGSSLVLNSDQLFHLETLPARMVVVGGGYIALEFAGILNGLGVDTHLVYRGAQLLRHFDQDIGPFVAKQMESQGITLWLKEDIKSIRQQGPGVTLTLSSGIELEAASVLYATGRSPDFEGLGLENTAIKLSDTGKIAVDPYFETAEAGLYALGDIIDSPELTPVALAEAMSFVKTWFLHRPELVDYTAIPTAVFCQPNVASVGMTEEQAREAYRVVKIFRTDFRPMKHTLSGREERCLMKLIVDADSDVVLGAHMVGAEAGEIIQGLAIAIKAKLTKQQWDETIGIHPTAAEEFVTLRSPV